jgi:hypothetical protein
MHQYTLETLEILPVAEADACLLVQYAHVM